MQEFRADLHCHTTCSDGTLTPNEVIQLAVSSGLSGLSITDHDSIDAYPEALEAGKKAGIEVISGVEFSTVHMGVNIHLLAYSFSLNAPEIQHLCAEHHKRRENRIKEMLFLLKKKGFEISEEDIYSTRNSKRGIGRPHLAKAMVEKGYVKDINEAFKKFLGEDKDCYASGKSHSAEETIEIIHKAKGFAILAHPHLIDNTAVLKNLLETPLDGIECYYARFSESQNKRWLSIAENKNLLKLGGSDFHGSVKPKIFLGCSWVPQDTFSILRNRFQENQA